MDSRSSGPQQPARSQAKPSHLRGRASLKRKLLAFCLAILVALLLGEIALRMVWHNPYRRELPDVVLKIRMNHIRTDHQIDRSRIYPEAPRALLRTDDRGYIIPSNQHEHPDVIIAFLGGSTTQCSVVREDLRFPALVSVLLGDHDIEANTLNAARSGNTIHDALNILLNHLPTDRPDIVVLMHAINDIGVLSAAGSYDARLGHPVFLRDLGKWTAQMASSRSHLAGLLRHTAIARGPSQGYGQADRLQWRNDPATTARMPTELYEQRVRAFVHLARDLGMQPVVMTQPLSEMTNELTPKWADLGAQDAFNAILRSVAEEEEVPLIDLARHVQETVPNWDQDMVIFYDGMHVTENGSLIYAKHIAERLLLVIRHSQSGGP